MNIKMGYGRYVSLVRTVCSIKNWIFKSAIPVYYYLICGLLFVALVLYGFGIDSWFPILVSVTFMLAANLWESRDWKNSFPFLMYNLAFGIFLIPRLWFDLLLEMPDYLDLQLYNGFTSALLLILVALITLNIIQNLFNRGLLPYVKPIGADEYSPCEERRFEVKPYFWYTAMICWILLACCKVACNIEIFEFTRKYSYHTYYTSYHSHLPIFIILGSLVWPIFTAFILGFFPRKILVFSILISGIFIELILLFSGLRNPVVLFTLFSLCYCVIYFGRTLIFPKSNKFRVISVIVVAVLILVSIVGLNWIKVSRGGESKGSLDPVSQLIYDQSVTFNLLARGTQTYEKLPNYNHALYTFGSTIDYLQQGRPAQLIFGVKPFEKKSSDLAINGNSFDAAYSYTFFKTLYLKGYGAGSSYIIEAYIDFGFLGVFIVNVLIGLFLVFTVRLTKRKWWVNGISLSILMNIFFLPRSTAMGDINFIFSPQFWLTSIFFLLLYRLSRLKNDTYPLELASANNDGGDE